MMRLTRLFLAISLICGALTAGESFACDVTPTAIISSPSWGCRVPVGTTLNFDGSDSHDNDENGQCINSWSWSFGGSGSEVSHTFNTAGVYDVGLTVHDDEGWSDTVYCRVNVVGVGSVTEYDSGLSYIYAAVNGDAFLQATPYPAGSWPIGQPTWDTSAGSIQSLGSGAARLSGMTEPGAYFPGATCGSTDSGAAITVIAFSVDVAGPTSVIVDSPAAFTATPTPGNVGGSFAWSFSGPLGEPPAGFSYDGGTATLVPHLPGVYTVATSYKKIYGGFLEPEATDSATVTATIDVQVSSPLTTTVNTTVPVTCEVAGAGGGNATWTARLMPNGSYSSNGFSPSVSTVPTTSPKTASTSFTPSQYGTYEVRVQYTEGGYTDTATSTIKVVAVDVSPSSPVTIAAGVPYGLGCTPWGGTGGDYSWSLASSPSSPSYSFSSTTAQNPTFTATTPGTYTVRIQCTVDGHSVSNTSAPITVVAINGIQATCGLRSSSTELTVCKNNTVNLSTTAEPSGTSWPSGTPTWQLSGPAGVGTLTPSGTTPGATAVLSGLTQSGVFTVRANCGTSYRTVTIVVIDVDIPVPAVPAYIVRNAELPLHASTYPEGITGGVCTWSPDSLVNPDTGANTTFSTSQAGSYTMTVQYERGGATASADRGLINVIGMDMGQPSGPITVELGDPVSLTCAPAGPTGGTTAWTKDSGPGNYSFSNSGGSATEFYVDQAGTYVARASYTLGSATATALSSTITVTPLSVTLTAPTSSPANTPVSVQCQPSGEGGTITWSAQGPGTVTWSPVDPTNSTNPTFSASQSGNYIIQVTYTKTNSLISASASDNKTVAITAPSGPPTASITPAGPLIVLAGEPIQFNAGGSDPLGRPITEYAWVVESLTYTPCAQDQSTFSPTFTESGIGTVKLAIKNSDGEWSSQVSVSVSVIVAHLTPKNPFSGYIAVNDDDDNGNGIMDYAEESWLPEWGTDDELVPFDLAVSTPFSQDRAEVRVDGVDQVLHVWADEQRTVGLIPGAQSSTQTVWDPAVTVDLEPVVASLAPSQGSEETDPVLTFTYLHKEGESYQSLVTLPYRMTAVKVDMDLGGVSDDWGDTGDTATQETMPGAVMPIGEGRPLIVWNPRPAIAGAAPMTLSWNSSKIEVVDMFTWTTMTSGMTVIDNVGDEILPNAMMYFIVRPVEASSQPRDITLTLSWTPVAGGPTFTDEIKVTVEDIVNVSPSSPVTIAAGVPYGLNCEPTGESSSDFTWSPVSVPGAVTFSDVHAQNPNFTAMVPGTYTVRVDCMVDGHGVFGTSAPITVVGINGIEARLGERSSTTELTVCTNDTVNLTAVMDPTGASWPSGTPTWQLSGPAGVGTLTPSGTTPSPTAVLSSLTQTGVYTVRADCGTSYATVTVTVIGVDITAPELPTYVVRSPRLSLSLQATAYPTGITGGSYAWSEELPVNPHDAAATTFSQRQAGSYMVMVRYSRGGATASATRGPINVIGVDVTQPSAASVTVEVGDPVSLTCAPAGPEGGTLAWTKSMGPGNYSFSPPDQASTQFYVDQAGTYFAQARYTLGGVTASAVKLITATPLTVTLTPPASALANAPVSLQCQPSSTSGTITWSAQGPGTVVWSPSDPTNSTNPTFFADQAGNYAIQVTYTKTSPAGSASVSDTETIVITSPSAPPTAIITPADPIAVAVGEEITLNGSGSDPYDRPITEYFWRVSNLGYTALSHNLPVFTTAFTGPGIGAVGLRVKNDAGEWSPEVSISSAAFKMSLTPVGTFSKYIAVNDDDDNENGLVDCPESPWLPEWKTDDDLKYFDLTIMTPFLDDVVELQVLGVLALDVWSDSTRTETYVTTGAWVKVWNPAPSELTRTIAVQARGPTNGDRLSDPNLRLVWIHGGYPAICAEYRMTAVRVDMDLGNGDSSDVHDVEGGAMTEETVPGGFISVGQCVKLTIYPVLPQSRDDFSANPEVWRTMSLSVPRGAEKVRFWQNADKTNPFDMATPLTSETTLYVEGVQASDSLRDVELCLTHQVSSLQDKILLTVMRVDASPAAGPIGTAVTLTLTPPGTGFLSDDTSLEVTGTYTPQGEQTTTATTLTYFPEEVYYDPARPDEVKIVIGDTGPDSIWLLANPQITASSSGTLTGNVTLHLTGGGTVISPATFQLYSQDELGRLVDDVFTPVETVISGQLLIVQVLVKDDGLGTPPDTQPVILQSQDALGNTIGSPPTEEYASSSVQITAARVTTGGVPGFHTYRSSPDDPIIPYALKVPPGVRPNTKYLYIVSGGSVTIR